MKVTFLKAHNNYKAGDEADLPDRLANYLVAIKAASIEIELEKKKIKKSSVKEKRTIKKPGS